ncbi:MAG TPA: hypothetical protein VFD83_04385 [Candidatus Polarisedimenticolia bacterium]|nr:hypothetical protein [Candidatus Polarisedimenticolia bacterium]
MSAVLLVRLKITDLSAWTALETGRRLLNPGHTLSRIVREQLLLFQPEPGKDADSFERALGEAVRHSNFFVNPNKESHRFLTAAERGERWTPPEGAWGILARAREETRDDRLLESLRREHPMPGLGAIRKARVWWLWSDDATYGQRVLGDLRDQKHGLLVNPHAEASMILNGAIPWNEVERFLTEPAPAFVNA